MGYIVDKVRDMVELSYEDVIELLNTKLLSDEYYEIIGDLLLKKLKKCYKMPVGTNIS